MLRLLSFSLLLCCSVACLPDLPDPSTTPLASNPYIATQELIAQAQTASDAGDFAKAIDLMSEAITLRPHHPTLHYRIARLQALDDRIEDALGSLQRVADMGIVANFDADPTLDTLRSLPAYQEIMTQIGISRQPVGQATEAFTWHSPTFIPEGIAYDPVTESYFVSSVHEQRIIQHASDGNVSLFSAESDSLWSVFGMKVDAERQLLWATTAAIPHGRETTIRYLGQSGLLKYDLTSGELLGRYLLPADSTDRWIGDLALADDGTVFATDSEQNIIYTLVPDSNELEPFYTSPDFVSLQGITLSADQTQLYVADYARGIYQLDRVRQEATLMPYPETATLLGVDGLYVVDGGLVAIQNGINPHRVVYAAFAPDATSITSVDVIAANLDAFDEPTLGVVVEDQFYFVANSQWGHFDENADLQLAELADPIVLRIPLP